MSSRKRAAHRRLQPYAWLGAGAVTLGMGAAIVGGPAVAMASTGADSAGGTSASASSDAASNDTKGEATHARASRTGRVNANSANDNSTSDATPVRRGRVLAAVEDVLPQVPAAAAATPAAAAVDSAASKNDAPAAAAAPAVTHPRLARISRDLTALVQSLPDTVPTVKAPAASVSAAAADPTPSYPESYLPGAPTIGGTNPGNQIIPGLHVQLALDEIAATQGLIKQATWGSGNFLAGIGSIAPQALLATAQLALMAWGATNPGVQNFLASTHGIPLVKWVARIAVFNELLVPTASQIAMGAAGLLIPTLGWVGADVTPAEEMLASAQENGKVYAIVPIRMKLGTEPTVKARINGGSKATLLVDTGASGIVVSPNAINVQNLGTPTGSGNSCFSGGLCYHYETYDTTVDLGNGATTTAPVNVVTDNDEYPESVQTFEDFFGWGADGIIGVGANTAGPGPSPIPTAAMPGELSDGALIFQNPLIFGLGSVMILGPNPLPTRVSVTGAPDAWVKVSVADGAKGTNGAIIDSGGVYGTILRSNVPDSVTPVNVDGTDYLPTGTKIDVYAPDGTTLLYSYTAKNPNNGQGTPVIDEGLFNTGNAPFAQGPIYLNYGADQPYGQGSTDFSIW